MLKLPKRVIVELTNRCNRTCGECPRHKTDYPKGIMSRKLFASIVDQLPSSTVVVPFFRGESLLHPHFSEMMRQLKRFKKVQLASNGDFLTWQNQEAILNNVTFFSLSLHDKLKPTQDQQQFLMKCREHNIETQVSFVGVPVNRPEFLEDWWFVDRIRFYVRHSINSIGDMPRRDSIPQTTCRKPFEEMVIYWDGNVGLCNHDWQNLSPVGNVKIKTVHEIWNSVGYNQIRDLHLKKMRGQIATCRSCSFDGNNVYGEIVYGRQK